MKFPPGSNPSVLLQSPMFQPLQHALAHFVGRDFPGLDEWNALLADHYQGISVHSGLPLRFVSQQSGRSGFESQYEPRCYLTGEVQTRPENWHDFFNALVWLTFPKSKAAINSRHYMALTHADAPKHSQRGNIRDMATLLDESGVIVVCANEQLANMLENFQWKELFWKNREQVCEGMGFYIFGHGLYEKACQPYVGMTGQGLILRVDCGFFSLSQEDQLKSIDTQVAAYLYDPSNCASTRELHPVPILGVPGWSVENDRETYYNNTAYFRPGRRG